jgi:hypothetical protein
LNTNLYGKYCNKEDGKTKHQVVYEEGDIVKVEYRNEEPLFIADVAIINNGKIRYVFEIHHSNKTLTETRPEPWFEVNAKDVINIDESNINLYNIRSNNYSYCKFCGSDKVDCDGIGHCFEQNDMLQLVKDKNCNCKLYKCSVPRCKEYIPLWIRYRNNGRCYPCDMRYGHSDEYHYKTNNEEYISERKNIYKNKFDFSNTLYIDDNTLIKVKCNTCNNIFINSPRKYIECSLCKYINNFNFTKSEYNGNILTMMQLAETGFQEWNDSEEDIYNDFCKKMLLHLYRKQSIKIQQRFKTQMKSCLQNFFRNATKNDILIF